MDHLFSITDLFIFALRRRWGKRRVSAATGHHDGEGYTWNTSANGSHRADAASGMRGLSSKVCSRWLSNQGVFKGRHGGRLDTVGGRFTAWSAG